jgi:hypothetical protein
VFGGGGVETIMTFMYWSVPLCTSQFDVDL